MLSFIVNVDLSHNLLIHQRKISYVASVTVNKDRIYPFAMAVQGQ
jgi:hypothetical protein